MRLPVLLALVVCGVSSVQNAFAQTDAFCLEVARKGLFDTFVSKSILTSEQDFRRNLCRNYSRTDTYDAKTSAKFLGFGVFATGKGDFSRAKSIADVTCDNQVDLRSSFNSQNSFASILSPQAVELVRACTQTQGLKIGGSYDPDGDKVNVQFHYVPVPGERVPSRELNRVIENGVTCIGDKPAPRSSITVSNIVRNLNCSRNPSPRNPQIGPYGSYFYRSSGSVTLQTTGGSFTIPLPPKVEAPNCIPQGVKLEFIKAENLCLGKKPECNDFEGAYVDSHYASARKNLDLRVIEYKATVAACGDYLVKTKYGAHYARPAQLIVDSRTYVVFSEPTGSWQPQNEIDEFVIPLSAGEHTIRIQSQGPFPAFQSLRIVPAP